MACVSFVCLVRFREALPSNNPLWTRYLGVIDETASTFTIVCDALAKLLRAGRIMMRRIWIYLFRLQIWRDARGQDLIEYSLLVGFFVLAAGALFPPFRDSIMTIFSKVASLMEEAP